MKDDTISINEYRNIIAKTQRLSSNAERIFIEEAHKGNKEARNKLIEANLYVILHYIIRLFAKGQINNHNAIDCMHEGIFGLTEAIEKFDLSKDNKLSTYSLYWIRFSIDKYLKNNADIRLPDDYNRKVFKYFETENKLTQRLMRQPTRSEIAKELGINIDSADKIISLKNYKTLVSLNNPINCESDATLVDIFPDLSVSTEDEVLRKQEQKEINNLLNSILTPRNADIIKSRYGFYGKSQTLELIGKRHHVSKERIRQIEKMTLEKLSINMTIQNLYYA